jgi:hypothetical protein
MHARFALPVLMLILATPLSAGTVVLRTGNYIGTTTTQTFTVSKQIFSGSTNCTSGGGAVTNVSGIDQGIGHSFALSAGDSALLIMAPGAASPTTEQNGPFVSWYTDPAYWPDTIWGPGDGRQICVGGFPAETREYVARFYAGILLYDLCGNVRNTFAPGETMEIRVAGGLTFMAEPHRLIVAGGSVNECSWLPEGPAYTTVHVDADPYSRMFTLPSLDAEIPASCISSNSTSILGNWRVVAYDVPGCGCNRSQLNFSVAADAPPPPPCSITCPDDITVSNDAGACGAVVPYAAPAGATCTQGSGSFFPIGTTTVTCTAGSLSCDFDVTVSDDQPPVISTAALPSVLWPPNHQMVDVTVTTSVVDNCAAASCAITSVTSNEPANADGDGDAAPDWEIVDATHVRLRAERSGTGSGRVYTITIACGDETQSVTVAVPKKR